MDDNQVETYNLPTAELAANITRNASKQTYTTIQALVPGDRQGDAFRAYAYFRWLDDLLDGDALDLQERFEILNSQILLLRTCLEGQRPIDLTAEEWLLADLTQGALAQDPGLQTYLLDMMAVMKFDMGRRGRRINHEQLTWYSRCLATAVTEAVYTFIGDSCGAPRTTDRYLAADAAHIAHMLRDMVEDLEAGYVNIPVEVLGGSHIDPSVLKGPIIREWVKERTQLAREYFALGEAYLANVENPRCRLAGAWYAARFERVLDAIEQEDFILRRDYSDCLSNRALLRMAWGGLGAVFSNRRSLPIATRLTSGHHVPAFIMIPSHSKTHEETLVQ